MLPELIKPDLASSVAIPQMVAVAVPPGGDHPEMAVFTRSRKARKVLSF